MWGFGKAAMPPRKVVVQGKKKPDPPPQPAVSLLPKNRSAKKGIQMMNALTVRGAMIRKAD